MNEFGKTLLNSSCVEPGDVVATAEVLTVDANQANLHLELVSKVFLTLRELTNDRDAYHQRIGKTRRNS